MQKKILTLLVLLMTAVTGAWATDSHWPDFIPGDYEDNKPFVAGIMIDGVIITADYEDWDQLEVAAFVGDECRSAGDIPNYLTNDYVLGYGDPFPVLDGMPIFFNGDGGEALTFKMYNHATGVEYTTCTVTLNGEETPVLTGQEHTEGWFDPENPVFLNFTTPAAPAGPTDYYLVGNMTSWEINPQYKLALNESAGDANEYQIALALPAATELKVVSSTDGTTIKDWFPAEAGNKYVQNDGLYTIYFRPGYNGGSDWHAGCIYVADGVNLTADGEAWTLAQMPACNVELEVEYFPLATLATLPAAAEGVVEGTDAALLTPGTSAEGTLAYALGTSEAPTGQWSDAIPTAQDLEAGTCYVWYKVVGNAEHSDSQPQSIAVTIAEAPAYAVTIDDAGVDASNWQATPAEPKTGQTVTLSYSGKKKVKSITIEAAEAAPTGNSVDLSTLTADYEAQNGDILTGALAEGVNVKVSIADGATVTLDGVTINGVDDSSYSWAGITCLGDATIILSGTNTVKGFNWYYPGIHVPQNKTLTIEGSGSLTASSNGFGCGIGGGNSINCGNIVIAGGTITATGGDAAGIGGGFNSSCGNISITGGTVTANGGSFAAGIGGGQRDDGGGLCGNISITGGTINANGGAFAAGIGSGYNGQCGTVTITDGVTSVTATMGFNADYSIGAGFGGSCGTVTIGGTEGAITTSPYTYEP